ncbi:tetracycline resistance protein TetA [Gordoniibacillus kamchatkensis]|uniref:Tetracycline resistance protein TetA n=2 Tax=Gordoniibacillus kamchatkensis TaxID=1590651 RepID=A0ABR5AFG5_9BACL|nr:tetracycline resistance protein TetA [Paenibacillus sp. VKM B-2647]
MASVRASESTAVLREGLLLALLSLTVTLVVMNTTMFNVALPQVSKDFGLSSTMASWIVTGYSIVFAIFSITYSRLSDFIPIRLLLTIGLADLVVASLLGLFSHHFIPLLLARLLQAAGAASAPGLGIVLITRYIPASRRGKAMSYIMSSASLGFGLGPVLGGAITQYLGWNFLFVVTGIVLVLIPFFYRSLPLENANKGHFDLIGAVLVGIGTTGLLLFLTTYSAVALVAGAVSLVAFWLRIRRVHSPFVQPALFRNKAYMTLSAMGFVSYVAQFTSLFLMPMLLIRLFGVSSAATGLLIFPGAITAAIASNGIGKLIDRFGNRPLFRWGHVLLLGATLLFAMFGKVSPYAVLGIYMLMSVGITSVTTSVSNEMSRILPKDMVGAGMGLAQLTQFFGGAFGVAMTGIALVWQKNLSLAAAFSNIFWVMVVVMAVSALLSVAYRASGMAYRSAN